ncbi:MAG: glycosyltransferase, partial [Verrucomicrobia bacterium]
MTKSARQRHHSGLTRMSRCLRSALAETSAAPVIDVVWHPRRRRFVTAEGRRPVDAAPDDWLLTPEIFCEAERPGFADWMAAAPGRKAVIYYDAIPLKFPEICWPQSVARHPGYMKLLAAFDRVLAISRASAEELSAYWQWIGVRQAAPVALQLGADGHGSPRWCEPVDRASSRTLVMVSIVEPRKNQDGVLDACEQLWKRGLPCHLEVFGRVNPHFGRETERRMRHLARAGYPVRFHGNVPDAEVAAALAGARALLMPSIAEGCGLPILEALWNGVPV